MRDSGGLYATCANCGQVVRNNVKGWHDHACVPSGLQVMASAPLDHDPGRARARYGFSGKVNPGGIGKKRIPESSLACELIALHTDLARWNEFAEWEATNAS